MIIDDNGQALYSERHVRWLVEKDMLNRGLIPNEVIMKSKEVFDTSTGDRAGKMHTKLEFYAVSAVKYSVVQGVTLEEGVVKGNTNDSATVPCPIKFIEVNGNV